MTTNGNNVLVLYKIVNSDCDAHDPLFNAFSMPFTSKGATLASVKQHCAALHGLNHLGPEGYHWRVCVEDKPVPGEDETRDSFSWWDVQDENAKLPIKQASQHQLSKFFAPPKSSEASTTEAATKAAKGAFKSLGKAVSHAVGADGLDHHGPPVSVIAFKLLDLVKMHDDFASKNHGRGGHIPQPVPHKPAQPRSAAPRARASAPSHPAQQRPPPPQQQQQHRPQPTPSRTPAPAPRAAAAAAQEASLMDFGPEPSSAPLGGGKYHRATSSPPVFNESRAERLKREYTKNRQNSNRVWDEVDQRWVEVESVHASKGTTSAPPGANAPPKRKHVGISLDPANAVGKSAAVQAAVEGRVNKMKEEQAKAVEENRAREEQKKREEAEEDMVRKKLTPMIKAWSEDHGKKKQLRALLASLHTILWPEANWKPVSIGDILDDSKVKRCFHKASRVVHPDKTHHLDAEKRFLAKRIFDALCQAKNDFDSGAR